MQVALHFQFFILLFANSLPWSYQDPSTSSFPRRSNWTFALVESDLLMFAFSSPVLSVRYTLTQSLACSLLSPEIHSFQFIIVIWFRFHPHLSIAALSNRTIPDHWYVHPLVSSHLFPLCSAILVIRIRHLRSTFDVYITTYPLNNFIFAHTFYFTILAHAKAGCHLHFLSVVFYTYIFSSSCSRFWLHHFGSSFYIHCRDSIMSSGSWAAYTTLALTLVDLNNDHSNRNNYLKGLGCKSMVWRWILQMFSPSLEIHDVYKGQLLRPVNIRWLCPGLGPHSLRSSHSSTHRTSLDNDKPRYVLR